MPDKSLSLHMRHLPCGKTWVIQVEMMKMTRNLWWFISREQIKSFKQELACESNLMLELPYFPRFIIPTAYPGNARSFGRRWTCKPSKGVDQNGRSCHLRWWLIAMAPPSRLGLEKFERGWNRCIDQFCLSSCWFWNLELPQQKAKQKLLQRGSCFKRVSGTCSSFAIVSALEIPQVLINNYLSLGVLEWLMQKIPSSEGWYWIWLLLHVIYQNFQLWALSDTSPDHLSRKPDGWKSSGWPEPN